MNRKLIGSIINTPATMWEKIAINAGLKRRSIPTLAALIKAIKMKLTRVRFHFGRLVNESDLLAIEFELEELFIVPQKNKRKSS